MRHLVYHYCRHVFVRHVFVLQLTHATIRVHLDSTPVFLVLATIQYR